MSASIVFDVGNGVATIRLNRPDRLNAFNREMASSFKEKLKVCASDRSIRAILLTGTGKAFSAGQDLDAINDPGGTGVASMLQEHYNPIVRMIRQMPKPVLAAVNGVAAGAGANLALCCDIVVASENASFIQAFSKIGLIPDCGGSFFLPRLIGWQKASALMMLGDKVSAVDAERLGMVYQVMPVEQFDGYCRELAEKLAAMPTHALALTKHALGYAMTNGLEAQLDLEDKLQQESALTYDFREGVEAFLNKRPPVYRGE